MNSGTKKNAKTEIKRQNRLKPTEETPVKFKQIKRKQGETKKLKNTKERIRATEDRAGHLSSGRLESQNERRNGSLLYVSGNSKRGSVTA